MIDFKLNCNTHTHTFIFDRVNKWFWFHANFYNLSFISEKLIKIRFLQNCACLTWQISLVCNKHQVFVHTLSLWMCLILQRKTAIIWLFVLCILMNLQQFLHIVCVFWKLFWSRIDQTVNITTTATVALLLSPISLIVPGYESFFVPIAFSTFISNCASVSSSITHTHTR